MGDVNDITDAELVRRVIDNAAVRARSPSARTVPLWSKVGDRFSLGSTYSAQICRRFGFDPDQEVRP